MHKKWTRRTISVLLVWTLVFSLFGMFPSRVGIAAADGTPAQIRSAKIEWMTQDSTSDGQANRLFLRKDSADSEASMQFKIEVVLTGQEPHEPGSVRILFPRQIWHQRDSYYDGGQVQSAGYGGMTFSVPDKPSENSAWYWEEAENGQYAIVNDAAINAAAQVSFECTITGIDVSKIVDMKPSDPLKATVEVTTRSGVKDTMSTQELTAVIDTREYLSDPGAGMSGQMYSTPESVPAGAKENLPGGPDTANKYVYVCWTTWPLYEGSQYFSLDMDVWAGVAEGNGVSIPGIILGEGGVSGGTVGTESSGEQAGEHYSRQTVRYNYDGRGWSDYRAREIWVAYPTDRMQDNKTYTIRAASQWTLTEADPEVGSDPREVSRAGATASVNYLHAGWEYPAGTFGVYKYSGSQPSHTHNTIVKDRPDGSVSSQGHKKDKTYEMAVGALRNGKTVTLDFEVLTVGYGYSYTAGPTSEVPDLPEGWEQDPAHYLNWSYRMETTDDTISVANISNGGNLGAGDYRFENITIAAPEMFSYGRQTQEIYRLPNSEFGYRPDNSLPKPDVEVWVEKNKSGSWELYQTVSLRSGTKKITFPADANVTGYRTVIVTNQAACKLAVWPKVTILPSEHVLQLAEERLQGYTNVVLKNGVRQVTTFYQSAERQDEVLPEQTAWLEANDDYTTESSDSSLSTLTEAGYKVYGSMPSTGDYTYTRTSNDPANHRVVVTLFAAVYEQANVTDGTKYNEAVAMGAITPETSGTWYLLLPEHFVPNTSTIQMRSGDRVTDVKVTENFRNSGRTLVTVKATLTPDPKKLSDYNSQANHCWGDKIQISMDMYVPWSDYNKVKERYAVYYAAFESGNPGRLGNLTDQNYYQTVGYPDKWPETSNTYLYSISNKQIRGWMSDLDPDSDEERFVYLRVSESIRDADLSEQVEFRKDARADRDSSWGKGTRDENQVTVTEGGKYTYRLTVASKQDAKTMGILIYDALEEYVPHEGYDQDDVNGKKAWSGAWNGKGQWKGTLESVDLSELYGDRCMGRLYYSTTSGLVFDNNIDTNVQGWVNFDSGAWGSAYRLTDTDIWTEVTGSLENGVWTVPDALKGKVTAIAVNAERYNQADIAASYVLDPGEKLSIYLNMAAPTDGGDDSKWNAKGAYDHKKDNAASTDDIDWIGAADPANNMYAYNTATTVFIPFVKSGNSEQAQPRARLESAYSRVGIVPSVVSVRKTWNDGESVNGQYMENRDGLRPKSVTVHLTGVSADPESKIEQSITLSDENGWKGVFQNAPDTDSDGNPYTYTVTEDLVPGYTTGVYKEEGRSYEIVNTHKKETFTLRGEKLWLNPDGTPVEPTVDSVTIAYRRIGSNGPESSTRSLTVKPDETGRWIYEFKDLDRYEPGGFEYRYVLEEHSVPDGWFSQNDAAPAGVTVTAEYDPEDLTTFRNFKKPEFGYAMIYSILTDECKPKDGNTAVPTFTFTVDMTKDGATVGGEYEYILYDKAPQYTGYTTLPEGTAQIGSGTVRNGDTITLPPGQAMVIIGIPDDTSCTVTEIVGAGWTTNQYHDQVTGTIWTGRTSSFSFRNTYKATTSITITGTKRLVGREQRAKEFAFNLTDNNRFSDYGYENSDYMSVIATVKTGESRGVVTGEDGTKTGLAMFTFRATYDGNSTYTMYEYGGTKVLHYRVEEAIPAGAQANGDGTVTFKNVIYDTTRQDVTVTITDNMDGTLKVTSTPLVFTNTYRLQKKISLTAHKELQGRTLQPDEFSFEVRREGAEEGSAPIARGKNDGDGNITFSPEITLTEKDLASIDPETGIGEVRFLISEVQGTDPTVAYMTKPVEAVVQIGLTADSQILTAIPGQTLKHREEDCAMCGGTGESGGLTAVLVDSNDGALTGILPLGDYFSSQYLEICSACQGTGYDPASPGTACGACSGDGFTFIDCTHANQTGAACPDCFDMVSPYKVLRVNGTVLAPVSGSMTMASVATNYGIDTTTYPPCASCTVKVAYVFSEAEWNSAAASGNLQNLFMGDADTAALIYLAEGDGECTACHGTGKVDGELYVDGEPEPVALVNHLKTGIQFKAEKLMDGQPAAEPFEFVLLETDEARSTEKEIARTKNGTDGKILFENVYVDPAVAGDRYYVIREAEGTNPTVEYDTEEDLYKVTVITSPDGINTVEVKLMSGDAVFRNTYKNGSLAVTVKADGESAENVPKFPVEITFKDKDGKPLAGVTLTEGVSLRKRGGEPVEHTTDANGTVTVSVPAGKTVVLDGIPHGTTYTAVQKDVPNGFAESSAEGATGEITGGDQSTVSFANDYGSTGSLSVSGVKELLGRELFTGEFAFELIDRTPNSEHSGEVIATARSGEGQQSDVDESTDYISSTGFDFSEISLSSGVYGDSYTLTYEIREVVPKGAETLADGRKQYQGVIYDTEAKTVTVTVTDQMDGTLKAEVTSEQVIFRNEYHAEKKITLTALKVLNGRPLKENEFSFEVRRSDAAAGSDPIAVGTNDADGKIVFSPAIVLTEKDIPSVTLLINEVKGTDGEVIYLSEPVPVEIRVFAGRDGELAAALPGQTVAYEEDECPLCGGKGECSACGGTGKGKGNPVVSGEPEIAELTNMVYPAVRFTAEKTMEGEPAKDAYKFVLVSVNADGTEKKLETAYNTSDGKISFASILLKEAGEYVYVIREIEGTDSTIQYDSHEERYVVTVSLGEKGNLVAEMKHTDGDGIFRNKYKDGSLAVTVTVDGDVPKDSNPEFVTEIIFRDQNGKPMAGLSLKRGENASCVADENGKVTLRLTAGQTVVLGGIPHGAAYEAKQVLTSLPEGYSQTGVTGATGVIRGGEQNTVTIRNSYEVEEEEVTPSPTVEPAPTEEPIPTPTPYVDPEPPVKTGDPAQPGVWVVCLIICLFAIALVSFAVVKTSDRR